MNTAILHTALIGCGILHLVLSTGSLVIPKLLNWNSELAKVQPLIRQMFWTYAGYILVINACFGIVSVMGADELLNHSFLAKSITLFITAYWLVRIGIQFFYFDKSSAPKGLLFTFGEVALVGLFVLFTLVYGVAFLSNMGWI